MYRFDMEKFNQRKNDIVNFILESNYPEKQKRNFIETILTNPEKVNCTLYQIYSKFGIIPSNEDIYKYFYTLLNQYKFLETNCCEVASGKYPRLSEIVYPTLKENGKSLTIYEPNLIIDELFDAILKKKEFTQSTDIQGIDTLFGTFTCEATVTIVEKALMEQKNLLIGICNCNHATDKYPMMYPRYYFDRVNEIISQNGDLQEFDLPEIYWCESFCEEIKKEYKDRISILNWPSIYGLRQPIILSITEEHKRKHLKI